LLLLLWHLLELLLLRLLLLWLLLNRWLCSWHLLLLLLFILLELLELLFYVLFGLIVIFGLHLIISWIIDFINILLWIIFIFLRILILFLFEFTLCRTNWETTFIFIFKNTLWLLLCRLLILCCESISLILSSLSSCLWVIFLLYRLSLVSSCRKSELIISML
jgi:hypothetical protein